MSQKVVLLDSEVVTTILSIRSRRRKLKEHILRRLEGWLFVINPVVRAEVLSWVRTVGERQRLVVGEFLAQAALLDITTETADCYADDLWDELPTFSENDKWIASTVMEHGVHLACIDSDFLRAEHLKEQIVYFDKNEIDRP